MRPKSTKEDFKDLPIERLMELCAFYDCQAQNYYSKWMKCSRQLYLAEIVLSKDGYELFDDKVSDYYGYQLKIPKVVDIPEYARVNYISEIINIETDNIIEFLKSLGIFVKPAQSLDLEIIDIVVKKFGYRLAYPPEYYNCK